MGLCLRTGTHCLQVVPLLGPRPPGLLAPHWLGSGCCFWTTGCSICNQAVIFPWVEWMSWVPLPNCAFGLLLPTFQSAMISPLLVRLMSFENESKCKKPMLFIKSNNTTKSLLVLQSPCCVALIMYQLRLWGEQSAAVVHKLESTLCKWPESKFLNDCTKQTHSSPPSGNCATWGGFSCPSPPFPHRLF